MADVTFDVERSDSSSETEATKIDDVGDTEEVGMGNFSGTEEGALDGCIKG